MMHHTCVGPGALPDCSIPVRFGALVRAVFPVLSPVSLLVMLLGGWVLATSPSVIAGDTPSVGERWYALSNSADDLRIIAGLDGEVHDVITWDDGNGPRLYIGGRFRLGSSSTEWPLAYWDGDGWVGVSHFLIGNGPVRALHESTSGDLLIGGSFQQSIIGLRNDGTSSDFFSLGNSQIIGTVYDIAYSAGGTLLAAGAYRDSTAEIKGVARYDGTQWTRLHDLDGGFNGIVHAIAIVNGVIHVAGTFSEVDGQAIRGLARRVSAQWQAVGPGVDGNVLTLAARPGTGELYLGGSFENTADGLTPLNRLAKWDVAAATMSSLDPAPTSGVTALHFQTTDELFIGVVDADGYDLRHLDVSDSSLPAQFDSGVNGRIRAFGHGPNDDLVVAGDVVSVGDRQIGVESVALHDGIWRSLARPQLAGIDVLSGLPSPQTVGGVGQDSAGQIYLGAGEANTWGSGVVMRWDEQSWQRLEGIAITNAPSLLVDSQDRVFAYRALIQLDPADPQFIPMVYWDGTSWHSAGEFSQAANAIMDVVEDSSGEIVAVGEFGLVELGPSYIAGWDGSTWRTWGDGLNEWWNFPVLTAVAIYQGQPFVGGRNIQAVKGAVSSGAQWLPDEQSWKGAGTELVRQDPPSARVNDFAIDASGRLVVAGLFDRHEFDPDTVQLENIAYFERTSDNPFSPVWKLIEGGGTNGEILKLAMDDQGRLIAVGNFSEAGGSPARRIARWDGTTWEELGGGANGIVNSVDILVNGDVIVTGQFTEVGGQPIRHIAAYGEVESTIIEVDAPAVVGIEQPTTLRAVLTGVSAPAAGFVTLAVTSDGEPNEFCHVESLVVFDTDSVEADCEFTFYSSSTRTLTATYWGGTNASGTWAPSESDPVMITVLQAQTLSFAPVADQVYAPSASFEVSGSATSGLPVVFSSLTPDVCTVVGTTVSMLGAGTCTLEASQSGDDTFAPAPSVQQDVDIARASQSIDVTGPSQLLFEAGAQFEIAATASSGLAVSAFSLTPDICSVNGTSVSMHAVGKCTLNFEQSGNDNWLPADTTEFDVMLLGEDIFNDRFEAP